VSAEEFVGGREPEYDLQIELSFNESVTFKIASRIFGSAKLTVSLE